MYSVIWSGLDGTVLLIIRSKCIKHLIYRCHISSRRHSSLNELSYAIPNKSSNLIYSSLRESMMSKCIVCTVCQVLQSIEYCSIHIKYRCLVSHVIHLLVLFVIMLIPIIICELRLSINNDATKNPAQEGGSCAGLLYTNESNLSIVCYSIVIYFDFGSSGFFSIFGTVSLSTPSSNLALISS